MNKNTIYYKIFDKYLSLIFNEYEVEAVYERVFHLYNKNKKIKIGLSLDTDIFRSLWRIGVSFYDDNCYFIENIYIPNVDGEIIPNKVVIVDFKRRLEEYENNILIDRIL